MDCAARVVCRASKHEHISHLLADLHWLPVCYRNEYKIATVCHTVISGSAPPCLTDLLRLYIPSRSLRSSADPSIFRIPIRRKKSRGQHGFSYIGLFVWNRFPYVCVPVSSPSRGGDVMVYVYDIHQPSLPTPCILFLRLFLSLWPFKLYFIP